MNKKVSIIAAGILAIVAFLGIFQLSLINTPPDYYLNRDDAIITLSHARNLIDFGFIGVNPSGERIEGFSAPLQFLIFVITYGVSHIDYSTFFQLQTYLFTALLGLTFFYFYYLLTRLYTTALILSVLSALLLSQLNTFILWQNSGMENAITNFLYLLVFLTLFIFYQNKKISYWGIIPILLASFSRLESIIHISFLLLPFLFLYRSHTRGKKIFKFLTLFYFLWFSLFSMKAAYFGDILSNTIYAQNKYFSTNSILNQILTNVTYHQIILGILLITILIILGIIQIYPYKRNKINAFIYISNACVLAGAFFHILVFGYARLDPGRVISFIAPFIILSLCYMLWEAHIKSTYKLAIGSLLVGVAFFIFGGRYYLCCGTKDIENTRETIDKIALEEKIMRPYVAIPELGATSFHKEFNIIDLGMLGNEFLSKVRDQKIISDYFFDFAQPDIVELHGIWSCNTYRYLLEDPRFNNLYKAFSVGQDTWLESNCQSYPLITSGIWIRKDILANTDTPERHFLDDLSDSLSVQRISTELENCKKAGDNCIYVLKTVYRLLPEIRKKGLYEETIKTFRNSNYDQSFKKVSIALLNSYTNGNISNDILSYLK